MRMMQGRRIGVVVVIVAAGCVGQVQGDDAVAVLYARLPQLERLKQHVETLASPEFGGRRGAGARKAEAYIAGKLRALGLEPLFEGRFTQDIPGPEEGTVIGRNVGAVLRGGDPELADEFVLLSAHYDHLGSPGGVLYPGADDNASGIAMLLEVARSLADSPDRPRRSVLFVAFDLEENGLWGSRYLVEHPPVPLDQIGLFLTADLIAGSLGGVCDDQVFVIGSERAPEVRPWIESAATDQPVEVAMVGTDLLVVDRSDYGPFRLRSIPYLFFSTGESPRYHTPDDTPESLDYPKLEAISQVIHGVVERAAEADMRPVWRGEPVHDLAEATAIRRVLTILLANKSDLKIGGFQENLMTSTLRLLDEILERGSITPAERNRILRAAQVVLFSVL